MNSLTLSAIGNFREGSKRERKKEQEISQGWLLWVGQRVVLRLRGMVNRLTAKVSNPTTRALTGQF